MREFEPDHWVACHLVAPGSRAPRIADTPASVPVTGA
jgi:hypothetical protein